MRARAAAAIVATLVVGGACTGGDGSVGRAGGTSTTTVSNTSSSSPATSTTAVAVTDPPGSVTFHIRATTLPPGGVGLRVQVRSASPTLTVRRRGGGGPVQACAIGGTGGCTDLAAGATLAVAGLGVDLHAAAAEAALDEVTVTYLPVDRQVTLVTPPRPAGACAARPCQATFSLTPAQPGPFRLDGQGHGGQPRLTLTSNTLGGGSIRTLATVEGGGALSIRATLDAASEAVLAYSEEATGPVASLTAEIVWP